ncbi:alpha/beta fold hydrolase [Anthocerotibacter panamensis]|uniref:alpha/beta fold hydrolase n=1 Tax=Anthocerotibacter panamensis TaxID=2857077 RepID=UPI001C401597|nr:alpha/beta hydrolase [Anthocerotibacter panamensis]
MVPDFLPTATAQLTEPTSIALAQQIQRCDIVTTIFPKPIATSFVQGGDAGVPLLLLHGFDSSVLEYRRLFPQLAKAQETWAVDLVGFGFTERHPGFPFGPHAIQTHLYHFWQTLIQRPVILVGASMGGAAALDFALSHPECVQQLVLIDSVGFTEGVPPLVKLLFPPLDWLAVDFLRSPKLRQRASELSYTDQSLATPDAALCGSLPLYMAGWHQANLTFMKTGGYPFLGERIRQLAQETLILWGTQDKILDPKYALCFQEAIPHSKLIWIEQCGHVPHLEQPEIVSGHLLNFSS